MPTEHATRPAVLVVDDNEDVLTAVRLLLRSVAPTLHTATRPDALPTLLRERPYDCVLLDMNFARDASSGREGLEWLEKIRRLDPHAVVVMITGYGDVDLAVRAMKRGASDFVTKPWSNRRLVQAVEAAIRLRAERERASSRPIPDASPSRSEADAASSGSESGAAVLEGVIGESPAMRAVADVVRRVAPTDANVLVLGENGTGKELIAQAVHRLSGRSGGLVPVDLGAVPAGLFESELFGHRRGAFTGAEADRVGAVEAADGGTLFLDEIGNADPAAQAKLLAVLQRREVVRVGETQARSVDVRVVAATNAPLVQWVADGRFRQDLLYRLNTVEVRLPPLRERGDDVQTLADHFLSDYATRYGRELEGFAPSARQAMRGYGWPGNVRELQHTVERAVILADGHRIEADDLRFSAAPSRTDPVLDVDSLDLEEIERAAVRRALSKHGGNVTRAADELGLTRKSLYRRIEKYGL